MSNRTFVVYGITLVVALLAFGAWLDTDMGDTVGPMQLQDAQQAARESEAQRRFIEDQINQLSAEAYAQGLKDGAAGLAALQGGHADMQALQACAALLPQRAEPQLTAAH